MISFNEKERKLFALAMNESAEEGEIRNASYMLIKSLRDRKALEQQQPDPRQQIMQHFFGSFGSSGGTCTIFRQW
jgi:hypothetical protein